jgi:hypothetical protein
VNFLGFTEVALEDFMVGVNVDADCVKVVADWNLVDEGKAVVVADLDFVEEFSSEDIPPSLKKSLPGTHAELQNIQNPC